MANTVDKVLKIAEAEVGYLEKSKYAYKKDPSILYEKTKGAGKDNYTKFNKEMHDLYPSVMDFPASWCDAFVDWCFQKAYGVSNAKGLLGGDFNDYTVSSANLYKKKNAWYTTPKVGDQIFFRNSTRICHTGLVYKVDDTYVYTIEGNTSSKSGVIANGGAVEKKCYLLTYSKIEGYGRPKYDTAKSIEDVAVDVIEGKYGNGEIRKQKLEAEGYNYDEVKKVVNELLSKETEKKATSNKTSVKKPASTPVKDTYTQKKFIKDCQSVFGVEADGIAGKITMSKVKTISTLFNRKHKVVKYIQKYLKELKFYSGEIDSVYGEKSKAAIKKFQQAKKLKADGVIGKNTWKALFGVK